MPKAPITYREEFYSEVRGSRDPNTAAPLLKPIEWNRVETELGTCVEPRISQSAPDATGKVIQTDQTDAGISKITIMDEGTFQNQFGTGGGATVDYNT